MHHDDSSIIPLRIAHSARGNPFPGLKEGSLPVLSAGRLRGVGGLREAEGVEEVVEARKAEAHPLINGKKTSFHIPGLPGQADEFGAIAV